MRLNLYMKSGNIIVVRGVKEWKVRAEGNLIVLLHIERTWLANHLWKPTKLVMSSLDLSQIEAITIN